jgi:cytochrome c oxidase subunit 2
MASHVLDPAGPQAARIADLWWLMFWICAAVLAVVLIALVGAVLRGRGSSDAAADTPAEPGEERGMRLVVGGAVAATVVILIALLVASVVTGRRLSSLTAADPLTIEVIGHQWWWEVRYEAANPTERVVTANEIHIPVGRPVRINLRSDDVIHSFWVPSLHGKQDLIPGHPTTTWLQADRPGVFRGPCAEFCGLQHAHMALLVVAEPPSAFVAWLGTAR